MDYKSTFKQLVKDFIHRDGIDELMDMLEKTDFYSAPASSKYHEAYEGGLVEHSVNVYNELYQDVNVCSINPETIAIVSLFHDICKIGYYEVEMRNKKDENGKWIQYPFYIVNDKYPYGHGEKSVIMIEQFMKLTDEERMAIRWHMGAYSGQQDWNTLASAYNMFPLALLLHQADMRATYLNK